MTAWSRIGLMSRWIRLCPLLAVSLPFTGCVSYHARPIEPSRTEQEYRLRSLNDPGLREFIAKQTELKAGQWPPHALDLDALNLVALYFSPSLDAARAHVQSADAAVRTARGSVNPSLSLGAGHESGDEAPFIFHFDPTFTLVTAGKKGYRILQAEKLAEAAHIELSVTAWKTRARLRSLLIDHIFARQFADLQVQEQRLRRERVAMLQMRLTAGELSRPELEAALMDLASSDVALKSSEGAVLTSLAALAEAAGVPGAALSGFRFVLPYPESAPTGDDLIPDSIQREGLINRMDVRRALLEYAAAEAGLQLEVAKQYPDIEVNPGYSFDEGHHKFQVGPGFTIPFPNRNQGPIAEAESRRTEAEARFVAVQAQAIAEIETAFETYRASLAEYAETEKQNELQRNQESLTLRAKELGEIDRLWLTAVRLQGAAAARIRIEASRKMQLALGAVEDAVQQPLRRGALMYEITPVSPRRSPGKENQP